MSTLSASARHRPSVAAGERGWFRALRNVGLSAATSVLLLGLAILPLLTPAWINAAMSASGGVAAGATQAESHRLSDLTVRELLLGPGSFEIRFADGRPLYGAAEMAHMQDVRAVLLGFLGLALVAALVGGWTLARNRARASAWRAVARGGAGLALGLLAVGAFAAIAFGPAFELFHRLLFPGGNWAFDPAGSNLVRLYPLAFWQLSAAAYGGLAIAAGALAWYFARRRACALERPR